MLVILAVTVMALAEQELCEARAFVVPVEERPEAVALPGPAKDVPFEETELKSEELVVRVITVLDDA